VTRTGPPARLAVDEEAFGIRMRDLFDIAKSHADLPLEQVDQLLDHPAYEPRMAASASSTPRRGGASMTTDVNACTGSTWTATTG
jgi:hypothetical protein